MKNLFAFLPVLMIGLVLTSCSATKPSSTASKYFKALEKRDFDKAKGYVATYSLDQFNELIKNEEYVTKHYTIVRTEEVSETEANIYYTFDGSDGEHILKLVKENDEWMVVLEDEAGK
jgi:secreted PhoX family phosphatase